MFKKKHVCNNYLDELQYLIPINSPKRLPSKTVGGRCCGMLPPWPWNTSNSLTSGHSGIRCQRSTLIHGFNKSSLLTRDIWTFFCGKISNTLRQNTKPSPLSGSFFLGPIPKHWTSHYAVTPSWATPLISQDL